MVIERDASFGEARQIHGEQQEGHVPQVRFAEQHGELQLEHGLVLVLQ